MYARKGYERWTIGENDFKVSGHMASLKNQTIYLDEICRILSYQKCSVLRVQMLYYE